MPEFLKNFSDQITGYWNKFSLKQKIQIIAISVVGLATLVVLTLILSRPSYALYANNITPEQMNSIITVLTEQQIAYRYEDDATSLYVDASKLQDVKLQLAQAGVFTTAGFEYKDAFNTSLTTSSDVRTRMYQLAYENELGDYIQEIEAVESARVKIVLPDERKYILESDKEASASVMLTLRSDLNDEQVYGIASMVAGAVDNLSMENIRIMDSGTSKLLYNGGSSSGTMGSVSNYMEIQNLYESKYENEIESLLLARGLYDDAFVDVNLEIDFDEITTETETFSSAEDTGTGFATKVYLMESVGSSTNGSGTPGTDTNADTTTYLLDNSGGSDSSTSISDTDYIYNSQKEYRTKVYDILMDQSTVSVTFNKFVYYYEELLQASGALDGTTWEQFQIDNGGNKTITVDQSIYEFISNASRIDNVSILAYEVPQFIDAELPDNQVADYIPVIIIVLMIGLLGYAVYKGTEPVEITEVEPELSVEEMLATTKVSDELEAIEFDSKSEARLQIERFVDENPEAVAQLLRNWLNEDWE